MRSLTKNMFLSVIARAVALVTGLIVQREILVAYGSTFNGLTSSISQVMSYLVLLEAGLGTASIQALYQPLAKNDWKRVSSIFTATGVEYRKISAIFFSLLLGTAILFPFVVADQIEYWVSCLLMLVIGGSSVVSYIVGGKYSALLSADRKIYVLYILDILTITLSCVLRVVALKLGKNIVVVQSLNLGCALLKNVGYVFYVRNRYGKIDFQAKPDFEAISKRWNVLIHSLAGIVVNHTDILILTFFADLKLVSLYSVYNMVFGQMSTLIQTTFSQAPQASFGRIYNKDRREFKKIYTIYEWIFTILLFALCTIALIMILPFVSIYTKGITDINYVDRYLPILFTCILLMNQVRTPALIAVNISGAFRETQRGAIVESVLNLGISLTLFFFTELGLYGLLIGTICSYLYRTTDVLCYAYRHILQEPAWRFIRLAFINSLIMLGLYIVFVQLYPIHCFTFWGWIIKAIGISLVSIIAFGGINTLLNKSIFSEMVTICQLKMRNLQN